MLSEVCQNILEHAGSMGLGVRPALPVAAAGSAATWSCLP